MSTWDSHYSDRVRLLVEVLPFLDSERRFALKGGTAINLFEHDLPRLSIDIDLSWLPVSDYETDAREIAEALDWLGKRLSAPPLRLSVRSVKGNRLDVSRGRCLVKIETTPVMRGSVHAVRRLDVRPGVERQFGSAQVQVLHFADLYAGKLAAALSRQHPRDLFDVGRLLGREGIDDTLWRTFLVYLTCSPKPAAELLAPNVPAGFVALFDGHFRGMTAEPVTADELLQTRAALLARVGELLDGPSCAFLESVEREAPDFELIGRPQAAGLPAVRHKLQNLTRRLPAKREADRRQLAETLARIAL